ncbi:hypothetical protein ABT294_48040 [Nonomuraea sp. NPDC000554]|uniref:hypothetical protein n=1 Tax=Nonomuraea sp. NPDC000554 TaxID=3154259 RepID=UPI003316D231
MTCVQCGHPHPVPIRRRLRSARYSCRSCGALFRPGPPPAPDPAPDQERPAPADGDPLSAFMPDRMVRWVREEAGQATVADKPDRATLARWYKEFDALVAGARTSPDARAVVERVSELPLDQLPGKPPAFNKVCAALHATCYDAGLAASRLGGQDSAFVVERVSRLRHWLATAGRSTTWLEAPPAPAPAAAAVEELLTLPDSFTADQVRTLFTALFGVDKGPSVPGVRDRFGDERIRQALLTYLETGARPLREAVSDELDAP